MIPCQHVKNRKQHIVPKLALENLKYFESRDCLFESFRWSEERNVCFSRSLGCDPSQEDAIISFRFPSTSVRIKPPELANVVMWGPSHLGATVLLFAYWRRPWLPGAGNRTGSCRCGTWVSMRPFLHDWRHDQWGLLEWDFLQLCRQLLGIHAWRLCLI